MGKAKRPDKGRRDHATPLPAAPVAETWIVSQARPLAESLCDTEGLELVHLEYLRERGGRIMRLYIDKPGGVTLEDCAALSPHPFIRCSSWERQGEIRCTPNADVHPIRLSAVHPLLKV